MLDDVNYETFRFVGDEICCIIFMKCVVWALWKPEILRKFYCPFRGGLKNVFAKIMELYALLGSSQNLVNWTVQVLAKSHISGKW